MGTLRYALPVAASLLIITLPASAQTGNGGNGPDESGDEPLEDVAWLTGHWVGEGLGGWNEVLWSPPRAGSMSIGAAVIRRRPSMRRLAAAIALALAAGGAIGFAIGSTRVGSPAGAAPGTRTYLLLVHDNEAVQAAIRERGVDAIVERYATWARDLDREGRLVGAEKLTETVRWAGDGARTSTSVSGYFVILAADHDEAVETARGSPHVALGGIMEVRAIDAVAP